MKLEKKGQNVQSSSSQRFYRFHGAFVCHFIALAQNKLGVVIVNTYSNCLFLMIINGAAAIQKPIQKLSLIYRDHQWKY